MVFLLLSAALAAPPSAPPQDVRTGEVAGLLAGREPASAEGLVDVVHVLGFSPDGKVATYSDLADEAVGGYLWAFSVQDLTNDRVVASHRFEEGSIETLLDRSDVLREFGPVFHQDLRAQGIVLDPSLEVHALPWTWAGHEYRVRFVELPQGEDEWVARADVYVQASGLGEKKVGTVEWASMADCCGHPAAMLVKSPHEDRAALIVGAWSRGWEGPPNVWRHTVLGVHLTERFAP